MSQFILSAFADEINDKLTNQMDTLEQYGIRFIEMRGVNGKCLVQHSLPEVKEIKKRLDARGFKISAIGSPIGKIKITDNFATHLELFRHTIEIAQILETQYIRMFSFFIPEGKNPDLYRDEVMSRWWQFIKAAEGTGLTLLHENEKDIYGDTAERCLDLLDTMNCSYFKAVFDPANFVQCDVKTYPEAFNMMEKHIIYMHIKDALYRDHSVVPSGYGDGSVKEILTELNKSGYDGFLSIEPHLADFTGFAALEPNSSVNRKTEGGSGQYQIAGERELESGHDKFVIAFEALNRILADL